MSSGFPVTFDRPVEVRLVNYPSSLIGMRQLLVVGVVLGIGFTLGAGAARYLIPAPKESSSFANPVRGTSD